MTGKEIKYRISYALGDPTSHSYRSRGMSIFNNVRNKFATRSRGIFLTHYQQACILPLEEVKGRESILNNAIMTNCVVKRTGEVPKSIRNNNLYPYEFVGGATGHGYMFIEPSGLERFYHLPGNEHITGYTVLNNRAYIIMPNNRKSKLKYLKIVSIFENPYKVPFHLINGDCEYLTDDDEYPFNDDLFSFYYHYKQA